MSEVDGTLTVVAGNGSAGFSGDGGPALAAMFNGPRAVGVAYNGSSGEWNVWVADKNNMRVRHFQVGGNISTVAGTGNRGSTAVDTYSTSTALSAPTGVHVQFNASTNAHHLFVADYESHVVRDMVPDGMSTRIAGIAGYAGYQGDDGPGTNALLSNPVGIAGLQNATSNRTSIWFTEVITNRVRRVDEAGNIHTIGGDVNNGMPAPQMQLRSPTSVSATRNASDGVHTLWICDYGNHRVIKVGATGYPEAVAGDGRNGYRGDGGPAVAARLYYPSSIATLVNNDTQAVSLWIADSGNQRIRRVLENGSMVTFAGMGSVGASVSGTPASQTYLNWPAGVAALRNRTTGDVHVWIADTWNRRVLHVGGDGIMTVVAGRTAESGYAGDGGLASNATLNTPWTLAVVEDATTGEPRLWIADMSNHCIREVWRGQITMFAGNCTQSGVGQLGSVDRIRLYNPYGVAAVQDAASGNATLFVADSINHRVLRIAPDGNVTHFAGITGVTNTVVEGVPATQSSVATPYFAFPLANATSGDVDVWIPCIGTGTVRRVYLHVDPSPS
ncbi:hypothetical protein EON62_03445, partial [archaeon]